MKWRVKVTKSQTANIVKDIVEANEGREKTRDQTERRDVRGWTAEDEEE